jgi:hypothetical protein
MRPSFPLLEPPLGVWGVFSGTKTPQAPAQNGAKNPKKQKVLKYHFFNIKHYK